MGYVSLTCAVALCLTFAVSAFSNAKSKAAFAEFASAIRKLPVSRPQWAAPTAALAVTSEIACIFLVVVPRTRVLGYVAAFILIAAYTAVIAIALRRGSVGPCNCFGVGRARPMSWVDVGRNAFLLVLVGFGLMSTVTGFSQHPSALGMAMASAVGVLLAGTVVLLDDLTWLFTSPASAGPTRA